ncbi:MAG: hypothetical protein SGPRY_011048, partial [Prymnesium sp.]
VQYEPCEDGSFVLPSWLQLGGYDAHVPPQKELAQIAGRNARVLSSEVAVGNAVLTRSDRLMVVESDLKASNTRVLVRISI